MQLYLVDELLVDPYLQASIDVNSVFLLQSLTQNLLQKGVACIAVSSPPTLSPVNENDTEGMVVDLSSII